MKHLVVTLFIALAFAGCANNKLQSGAIQLDSKDTHSSGASSDASKEIPASDSKTATEVSSSTNSDSKNKKPKITVPEVEDTLPVVDVVILPDDFDSTDSPEISVAGRDVTDLQFEIVKGTNCPSDAADYKNKQASKQKVIVELAGRESGEYTLCLLGNNKESAQPTEKPTTVVWTHIGTESEAQTSTGTSTASAATTTGSTIPKTTATPKTTTTPKTTSTPTTSSTPKNTGGGTIETSKPCGAVAHGTTESRTRYASSEADFGEACAKETQTRTCNNGSFSAWTGTYGAASCNVKNAATCGGSAHGATESRTMYLAATVPYGSSCSPQTQQRTCNNGTWGQWSGSYSQTSCQPGAAASCDGYPHTHTQTRTRYQSSSVAYNQQCQPQSQTRTCNNGNWTAWTGSYSQDECSPAAPKNCGNTAHDSFETRTMYQSSSVAYNASCNSETQRRTCTNGSFGNWSGSFAYTSCTKQNPPAPTGGGVPCTNDPTRTCYGNQGHPCANDPTRTCFN